MKNICNVSCFLLVLATSVLIISCKCPVSPGIYTIEYSANSGTGVPPSDGKNYQEGDTVTVLGQGSLAKAAHVFTGWNTAANGLGTDHATGSNFTMGSADVTLFAVWTQNPTYTVTYNANTGAGTPPTDSNNYQAGDSVTVLGTGSLTKSGYTFAGWNTQSNGLGTDRAAGSSFLMGSANVTLYAVWSPVQSAGTSITFDVSYEQVVFASSSVTATQGDLLSVSTTNATLVSQGSSWLWRMDGANLTGQTSSTLSLDTTGISIGNHILDLFVLYQGVLYSGNLLVTVTP